MPTWSVWQKIMKNKSVFITGIGGFVGQYLAKELLEHGYQITGSVYKDDPKENIKELKKQCRLVRLNIYNANAVEKAVLDIKPDFIFHLAGFSSVGRSFANERLTYQLNFEGTLNLLQAAVKLKKLPRFVFASTSEVYGKFSPKNKTLTEADRVNPVSPYGISKTAAEQICNLYYDRFELPILISRSFNHSGPGQNENFVIPSFAKQISQIEKGRKKPIIEVGNLAVKRDISDVRDIACGYRLMAEKGKEGKTYQLCSGKSVSLKTILNKLLKLSEKKIKTKVSKKYFRVNDIPMIRGSYQLAKKDFGYKPTFSIDDTLGDSLTYWRLKS